MLRQAAAPGGRSLWLNALCQHVAAPPPPVPATPAQGAAGKLKAWFWRAMELQGQLEEQNAQAQLAGDQALAHEVRDHVWEPAHEFLLRHKLLADAAGVALDVVGVAAGVFVFVALPELAAAAVAGSALAATGLVTGSVASLEAVVLFGIDTTIFAAEVSGHEAYAKRLDDDPRVGWTRIACTIALLPDLPVDGLRTLKEIDETGEQAARALERSAEARQAAAKAGRDRLNITNPKKHPAAVARQLHKVRKYEAEAIAQSKLVEAANTEIKVRLLRDLGLFPAATAGGTALMATAPPGAVLSKAQAEQDENHLRTISPAKGMPKDIKMSIRMIAYSNSSQT